MEKVMCVPSNMPRNINEDYFEKAELTFLQRGDENFKQITPYCVVKTYDGKIFIYEKEGNLSCIGFGSHINQSDWSHSFKETIIKTIKRELKEELLMNDDEIICTTFFGKINDNSSYFGRTHVGLLYVVDTTRSEESIYNSNEIRNLKCVDLKKIPEYKLEYWSEIAAGMMVNHKCMYEIFFDIFDTNRKSRNEKDCFIQVINNVIEFKIRPLIEKIDATITNTTK